MYELKRYFAKYSNYGFLDLLLFRNYCQRALIVVVARLLYFDVVTTMIVIPVL